MLSESARMSSAAEARFRIQAPHPTARAVQVIPLDPASDRVVARLAESAWNGVTFVAASAFAGSDRRLVEEVERADLVVMVAAAGADARAAAIIGEACSRRRVPTATFVVRAASATDEALSKTLAQVRPWSLMVVIASDEDYVEDILRSFR
jgi:hypothetical protein